MERNWLWLQKGSDGPWGEGEPCPHTAESVSWVCSSLWLAACYY